MKRLMTAGLILVMLLAMAQACKKKDTSPSAPSPAAAATETATETATPTMAGTATPTATPTVTSTATSIPTRVCTPLGYGTPTVVPESGDAGSATPTAQNLGSIGGVDYLKVLGGLTEGSDDSDFYRLTFDSGSYYTAITCFNTAGGAIDYDVYVYDSSGTQVASYTTGTYTVGYICCFPNGAAGTYYIEVRRVSGSGPYALSIWST